MIFFAIITGGGGHITKPGGGVMRYYNPFSVLGESERKMLKAKLQLLNSAEEREVFSRATSLSHFGKEFNLLVQSVFPGVGSILLARGKNGNYSVVSSQGIKFDPAVLDFSAPNSIVRKAGEIEPIQRRAIYLPDLSNRIIFLGSKFSTFYRDSEEYVPGGHEIEEGTIEDARLGFDEVPLARSGAQAIAVVPILKYKHELPIGAIILVGGKGFLNPPLDLVVLRELADSLAEPLKEKLS